MEATSIETCVYSIIIYNEIKYNEVEDVSLTQEYNLTKTWSHICTKDIILYIGIYS